MSNIFLSGFLSLLIANVFAVNIVNDNVSPSEMKYRYNNLVDATVRVYLQKKNKKKLK